ncbi:TolC family protein [Pseudacidovorax intermedius]|uniref:TolC family protein n=1 Tax=Pseudacidovorax intermedius TaxID=433924 RepID=UPI0026F1DCC2|nr:TolC family protein [Pseudacidovorax intermedius]
MPFTPHRPWRLSPRHHPAWRPRLALTLGLLLAPWALAQPPALPASAVTAAPGPLRQAFEQAWARQPEARARAARQQAAEAGQRAASAWTPEPMALELSHRTDRATANDGQREWEAGLSIPLWRPGERSRGQAVAAAEAAAVFLREQAARLRLAGALREAWWPWARARIEQQVADAQLAHARTLAADVERRWRAGDLARSDLLQAQGTVAAARAVQAEAARAAVEAALRWQALTGGTAGSAAGPARLVDNVGAEAEPEPLAEAQPSTAAHPALAELAQRLAIARTQAELAARQGAGNPELTLGTTRERGSADEPARSTLNVGLRIPFGASARQEARQAAALAEAIELEAQWRLEESRLAAEQQAARARVDAARIRLAAAEERDALASQTLGLIEKSFRLGESDLPTRLRTTQEASDAARQLAASRIELAAAVSQWRQALGLLPE